MMTVANVLNTASFPGPVTAPTPLAINYQFFDTDELSVSSVTGGIETPLMLGIDYSVTGGAGNTGSVIPTFNILTGTTWTVLRISKLTQDTDYSAQSTFPEQSHEDALDRITLGQQDLEAVIERGIRISPADDQTSDMTLPLKALRAGLFLLFNAAGEPTAAALSDPGIIPTSGWGEAWILEPTSLAARANLEVIKDGENDHGVGLPITQIISGPNGTRPNAGAAGVGSLMFTTDHQRILYSNGSVWKDMSFEFASRAAIPSTSILGGRLVGTSDSREIFIDDGSTGMVAVNVASRGMMQGFKASWTNNILAGCGEGECSSWGSVDGQRYFLSHATGMEKDVAVTWAAGDGNGGWPDNTAVRPTGGWQHFFALGHTDGVQTDFGWDTDVDATALRADLEVIDAGFHHSYRRIYSIKTVAATEDIMQIRQTGDWFYYDDPTALLNDNLSLTTSNALHTVLNAPLGIESQILTNIYAESGTLVAYGLSAGIASVVDADHSLPVDGQIGAMTALSDLQQDTAGQVLLHTDTLQRIRGVVNTTDTLHFLVMGWMDDRGRYA